jgi:hypothetical protein
MKKLILGVALGWLAFGLVPAQAQFFPPVTQPFVRPPLFPNVGGPGAFSPYGYGQFGMGPYGAAPYGTTTPFGPSPYNAVPYGIGPFGGAPGVTGTPAAGAPGVGMNDPSVTGHPTRFFNYSKYFFTQGGAAASVPLPGTRTILGANPTPPATAVIGTAPPRGRANTGTGK